MKHVIIYIPGLGDQSKALMGFQRLALLLWRGHLVKIEIFPVYWKSSERFNIRYEQLLSKIDTLRQNGKVVSLVGTSAGASTALLAYSDRNDSVSGVATICGKLGGDVSGMLKQTNPRFALSYDLFQQTLPMLTTEQRKRILTLHGSTDYIVPKQHATLAGAPAHSVKFLGHIPTIAYILLFKSRTIVSFLKHISK